MSRLTEEMTNSGYRTATSFAACPTTMLAEGLEVNDGGRCIVTFGVGQYGWSTEFVNVGNARVGGAQIRFRICDWMPFSFLIW